jgi:hypothetical protein
VFRLGCLEEQVLDVRETSPLVSGTFTSAHTVSIRVCVTIIEKNFYKKCFCKYNEAVNLLSDCRLCMMFNNNNKIGGILCLCWCMEHVRINTAKAF